MENIKIYGYIEVAEGLYKNDPGKSIAIDSDYAPFYEAYVVNESGYIFKRIPTSPTYNRYTNFWAHVEGLARDIFVIQNDVWIISNVDDPKNAGDSYVYSLKTTNVKRY